MATETLATKASVSVSLASSIESVIDENFHREFAITVLGRTLEHLGTQMYKRRDVALAELVANAWDAGATEVHIEVPTPEKYVRGVSTILVEDNGLGMSADDVDDQYLVIGRNRRAEGQAAPRARKVMGRKGVGKLAGFGLGRRMEVLTWKDGKSTKIELDGKALKADVGESKELKIDGILGEPPADTEFTTGTRITMRELKHKTPPVITGLHQSLSRRFSRAVIGEMAIRINGEPLAAPTVDFVYREPSVGDEIADIDGDELVSYWAGFSKTVLPTELQGFTVLVNGKTAQAPPYFFGVEGTASGQHGTKYLTGVIEADFLDSGTDDESDKISTDRQEIDWDDDATQALKEWGEKLTRRLLRDRTTRRADQAEKSVSDNKQLKERLDALDEPSKAKATKFIRSLGSAETEPEKILALSDTIIQAFEYRQFHDYISELDDASEDPDELAKAVSYIKGWRMLESRALLEVIKGRIDIIEKFFSMVVNNAPETAHRRGDDNLHDLLGRYPWLINPDWQVLAEEKTITRQLQEWGADDVPASDRTRYDFLALASEDQLVVVEIKRGNHDATLRDLHQLEEYVNKLLAGRPNVTGLFVTGGQYAIPEVSRTNWDRRDDILLERWADVHRRTAAHYMHYKAVLEGDLLADNFSRKVKEVQMTRSVLAAGSAYRTQAERAEGLGPQDDRG